MEDKDMTTETWKSILDLIMGHVKFHLVIQGFLMHSLNDLFHCAFLPVPISFTKYFTSLMTETNRAFCLTQWVI